jgi:hypothetical protein
LSDDENRATDASREFEVVGKKHRGTTHHANADNTAPEVAEGCGLGQVEFAARPVGDHPANDNKRMSQQIASSKDEVHPRMSTELASRQDNRQDSGPGPPRTDS